MPPEAIAELLVTEAAIDKFGARAISTDEARQIPRNAHVLVRNPRGESPGKRRLLIGSTNGGRALTLVVEQTVDPTTWLIVTGWDSSPRERRLLPS
ncbi:MAG: hypothetical protein ACRDKL_03755 [Solirubrobacteraceae bacterium]